MYEFLLESLIESLEEGMSTSEIDAFKSRAMDYIRMEKEYDSHIQDSLDEEDAGSRILRKLESSACQMSRITVERIRAMWNTVIKSEGSDDDVNKKRLQILSQFADMKAVAFRAPDISRAQKTMNASHSGMDKLKSFLLDEIASSAANGRSPHPLLLVGSPGCGKTSLALSLASAFPERGSALISMSGKSAAFELCGSDQSWRASDFGLIIKAFLQAGSLSPVIVFDELDKAGTVILIHGRTVFSWNFLKGNQHGCSLTISSLFRWMFQTAGSYSRRTRLQAYLNHCWTGFPFSSWNRTAMKNFSVLLQASSPD